MNFTRNINARINRFKNMNKRDWLNFFVNNAIYIVMAILIAVVILREPTFLSVRTLINVLSQSSVKLILAFGVGGIIILQGTDLSLGRSVGFAMVISASLSQAETYASRFYPEIWLTAMPAFIKLLIPLLIAMAVCAFFSMINGYIVAIFKVHPFIVTLGMSVLLYGVLTLYYNSPEQGGQPIGGLSKEYSNFILGRIEGIGPLKFTGGFYIPYLVIYAVIVSIIVWVLWNKTVFGKNMFAVGGNPEAAAVSGVNVVGTFLLVYMMAGILYGLGGFLEAGRIGSANNSSGFNYELDAIAACVVGGISFSGGVGKVSGAIAGVLLFTVMSYGMIFANISFEYQNIIKGFIIVFAVALDTRKYLKKT
ncbi:galactose/methyl galactoside ABC transporter permease MglC [Petrocella sp. FN5]|uniref:galactose/methyl galactoside ABC transporter permease MglC n=1 Tax=Petrocella sp. FN5 TaxID=3032002 RepID=UPI0023DA11E1|nr:galactose/methyl galactoside ABC transporter permease MglC [Petrocella sp. FN5]MDF1618444.1 galactose/methyl galactoside ABC transporter permease MglC [Petrocella sp. FN5]